MRCRSAPGQAGVPGWAGPSAAPGAGLLRRFGQALDCHPRPGVDDQDQPPPGVGPDRLGLDNGTDYIFTLKFANPTIEGPSSGNPDALYGFINIDADKNAATGVTGTFLDSNGNEPGFGLYSPGSQGIDAYINLTSEGDPFLHPTPGLVDVVTTHGFNPIGMVGITYMSQDSSNPSMLTFSIPLSLFSNNQISLLDTGNFSVIIGNVNNPTDFLAPAAAVPEPGAVVLLGMGLSLSVWGAARLKGETRKSHRPQPRHGLSRLSPCWSWSPNNQSCRSSGAQERLRAAINMVPQGDPGP